MHTEIVCTFLILDITFYTTMLRFSVAITTDTNGIILESNRDSVKSTNHTNKNNNKNAARQTAIACETRSQC